MVARQRAGAKRGGGGIEAWALGPRGPPARAAARDRAARAARDPPRLRVAGAGLRVASRAHGGDTDGAAAGRERVGARRGGGGLEAWALGPHGSRSRLAQDKMEDQS